MGHVVILPYFCDKEVARFLKIVSRMSALRQQCQWSFLLAASPRTTPSIQLEQACQAVAPTCSFQCPSQVFGYPQGPSAMFWDCMEFVQANFPDDGGFSLWLESDMAPVKENWLDRLDAEWRTGNEPLMMGCYVPKVYKSRLLRRRKLLLEDHVNGGACYAKRFAARMPAEARNGVFDVVAYHFACKAGQVLLTDQIDFSTNERVRRDILNPAKVLLHGFLQDKDRFIEDCITPVTESERHSVGLNPVLDLMESAHRQIRVLMVRRGQQAMYENMLLAKRRDAISRRVA